MAEGAREVRVGPLVLGGERTAVIVPIMATDAASLTGELEALRGLRIDLVEWRIDAYRRDLDDAAHEAAVARALPAVRQALATIRADARDVPLLVSLRTAVEGGLRGLGDAAYASTLRAVAEAGADLVDIEGLRLPEDTARALVEGLRSSGAVVVGSHHEVDATPPTADMVGMLEHLAALGADVPKLAVMPRDAGDVLALLEAGYRYRASPTSRPAITISMGEMGVVTRLAGPELGSCATFASAGSASAPGQVPLDVVLGVLAVREG